MSNHPLPPFSLPPRRETALARYPRNLKMVAAAALLALLILPPAFIHGRFYQQLSKNGLDAAGNVLMASENNNGPVIQTDVTAVSLNDQNNRTLKLLPAPDSRITEDTALGSLPRVAEDGTQPWRAYARPFNTLDKRPRVAIVVTGLGMARTITDEFIDQLPPAVTLSFDAQGPVVGAWIARARQDGHETLLEIPMEPFDYPRSDPGPDTLLTTLPNSDNLGRLQNFLRRATGYVGITSTSGSRLTTDPTKLDTILQAIHARGLMTLDARTAPHSAVTDLAHNAGIPVATVTQRLDGDLSPEAIAIALNDLEKTAILNGRAIGIAAPTPVMLDQLKVWAQDLPQRGISLAPVSAMVK